MRLHPARIPLLRGSRYLRGESSHWCVAVPSMGSISCSQVMWRRATTSGPDGYFSGLRTPAPSVSGVTVSL